MKVSELLKVIEFSKRKIASIEKAISQDQNNNALVESLLNEWDLLEQYKIVLKRTNINVVAKGYFKNSDLNSTLGILIEFRETINKKIKLIEDLVCTDNEGLDKITLLGQRENYIKEYMELDRVIKEIEVKEEVI